MRPTTSAAAFPRALARERGRERMAEWVREAPFYALLTGLALVVAVAHLVLASTAGYAFARLRFVGRDALFAMVVATLMVPSQATLVPLFILVKHWPLLGDNDLFGRGGFGMLDTYWVLTVPM